MKKLDILTGSRKRAHGVEIYEQATYGSGCESAKKIFY